MKKLLALALLGALGAALTKRRTLPPERVDVYQEDGTLRTFEAGTQSAEGILPAAHEILSLAR